MELDGVEDYKFENEIQSGSAKLERGQPHEATLAATSIAYLCIQMNQS